MAYTIVDACTGCTACVRPCPVGAISGEKNALHTIDARLCIDCGACGRICHFEAVLDAHGALCVEVRRSAWPLPTFDLALCDGCRECIQVCPVSCLAMGHQVPKDPTLYPYLAEAKACIACEFCEEACPLDAVAMQAR